MKKFSIRKRYYPAGDFVWEVGGQLDGERHRRSFDTEEEAKAYQQSLRAQLTRVGYDILSLDAFQLQQARAALELLRP